MDTRGSKEQTALFPEPERTGNARVLPVVSEQKDIRYFAATPRSVMNNPKATGMGFWSINPYVGCAFGCAYCYARYAHRYAAERTATAAEQGTGDALPTDELPPWLAFERRIMIKREAPALVRKALARQGTLEALRHERVVIGTATDPYQPAERRFRITRGVLEVLAEQRDIGVTIITKSPLVTRDVDVLTRINERSRLSVHISLITVDRELARVLEPRAPTPEARLRAIARLRANGIEVGVNVMPVLPGITDAPEMIEELVRSVKVAGASYIGACALRLQATARERYLPFIAAEFPELAAKYRKAYSNGYQVGERYREGLSQRFAVVCERNGVAFGRYRASEDDDDETEVEAAESAAAQLDLLIQ
ncbi:MAG: radical SAM protein [bacterium]